MEFLFPMLGFGTYRIDNADIPAAIQGALDAGYRHFDCAIFTAMKLLLVKPLRMLALRERISSSHQRFGMLTKVMKRHWLLLNKPLRIYKWII
jgi:Aldo/keto reductases, related to diketogulonate reductase